MKTATLISAADAPRTAERLRRLRSLAWLLDNSIPLPGGYRIGLDPIIGQSRQPTPERSRQWWSKTYGGARNTECTFERFVTMKGGEDTPIIGYMLVDDQGRIAALAAGAPGALPVIDAKRREVFTEVDDEPVVLAPADLRLAAGRVCVGDGAVRYRGVLEQLGAEIPPDDDERHVPRARFHAQLARDFGPADTVEPLYLRVPDAAKASA